MKFVPKGPMNNIPALVQIIAWHQPGDKPLSELTMLSLLTHICIICLQWVKEDKDLLIQHSQYFGCWLPLDSRSHGISSNAIDLILLEYCSSSTREVKTFKLKIQAIIIFSPQNFVRWIIDEIIFLVIIIIIIFFCNHRGSTKVTASLSTRHPSQ